MLLIPFLRPFEEVVDCIRQLQEVGPPIEYCFDHGAYSCSIQCSSCMQRTGKTLIYRENNICKTDH